MKVHITAIILTLLLLFSAGCNGNQNETQDWGQILGMEPVK